MIEALNNIAPDELLWELLGAYEIAQAYEPWCELVGLIQDTPTSEQAYDEVHETYAQLWSAMGNAFFARLRTYTLRWEGRRQLATTHTRAPRSWRRRLA